MSVQLRPLRDDEFATRLAGERYAADMVEQARRLDRSAKPS